MAEQTWSLEEEYPPMRMVEYRPLALRMTAEWLHCAGLSCRSEYDLRSIAERLEKFILAELKGEGPTLRNEVADLVTKEDE